MRPSDETTALGVLHHAISLLFVFDRFRSPGKPGEVIEKLSTEDRTTLQQLTAQDLRYTAIPRSHYFLFGRSDRSEAMADFDKVLARSPRYHGRW